MIKITSASIERSAADMLALPVCEDNHIHQNPTLKKIISSARDLKEFSGKPKQRIIRYEPPDIKIKRCLLHGLGPQKEVNMETLRSFAGRAVKAALEADLKKIIIAMPVAETMGMENHQVLRALIEGACLGNHLFHKYKEKPKRKELQEILLLLPFKSTQKHRSLLERVKTICRSTIMAREWVSTPSNHKLPERFAQMINTASKIAGLKTLTMGETQLKKKKFGALLAVSAGSASGPKLVEMVYTPKSYKKTIVLVGKGVTFDTGGINLKSAAGLKTMKIDMAGAAAVAATLIALSQIKPEHRVVGVLPLVENMPSGKATRPGDIIKSLAGKTVEIGNTDAEGRLILIDAMAYAIKKYKPHTLIDLATLTGACVIALGENIAGVFSNDSSLSDAIIASGEVTHERCWQLPLPEDYKKLIKSDLADISNMASSRYGGAITAALFLKEFVGETRWAHIDIAGPVYTKKATDYCGAGGTGFGVRLLCDLIESL